MLSAVGGAPQPGERLLFVGRDFDFQLTSDQALTKMFGGTSWIPTRVFAVRKTGGVTVACAGGLYSAPAKGGTAFVPAAQVWTAVTGTFGFANATLAALTVALAVSTVYFSLTTGSTGAVTGDVFVFGNVVD